MPDLMIVARNTDLAARIAASATPFNYRVKHAMQASDAEAWGAQQPFDVVLIETAEEPSAVQKITARIWNLNPRAVVALFTPAQELSKPWEAITVGFMGLECFLGNHWLDDISELVERVARQRERTQPKAEVLIVEDLDTPRDIICAFVEHLGYSKVTGVSSATDALRLLEANPQRFVCVITDINMPEINGTQFVASVRHHKRLAHLPVVVLTAHGTAENLIDCLAAGASGFLVKPPSKDDLNRELARALRISLRGQNPRLVDSNKIDALREKLLERGM
jgi:DNA-binding NtrC family response regulator